MVSSKVRVGIAAVAMAMTGSAVRSEEVSHAQYVAFMTRMLAMGSFVNDHCPGMMSNATMLDLTAQKYGVSMNEIATPERVEEGKRIYAEYKAGGAEICSTVWEAFGNDGSLIPHFVVRR